MFELIWAPLMGALSVLFDEYQDPRLVTICLDGFAAGARLAPAKAVRGMGSCRLPARLCSRCMPLAQGGAERGEGG